MKKLFTTFLLMGVALCTWASYTAQYADGTKILTINYVDDGNSNLNLTDLITEDMRNAETLVLTGDWANKDLPKIGDMVARLIKDDNPNKKIFLDLSACSNMSCQVQYTGEGDIDWTSSDFKYTYNYGDAVLTNVQKVEGYKKPDGSFVQSWEQIQQIDGKPCVQVNGQWVEVVSVSEWGYYSEYWSENNPNPASWVSVAESDVTPDPNDPNKGTAEVQLAGSPFTFKNGNFHNSEKYLGGIAFPNNKNFTAIPEELFKDQTGLESVDFGNNLLWIGKSAFSGCTSLSEADVTTNTNLKVIGESAFEKCPIAQDLNLTNTDVRVIGARAFWHSGLTSFTGNDDLVIIGYEAFDNNLALTSVNLTKCTSLQRIDYEAFEFCSALATVSFPSGSTLTHIGNDCFKQTALVNVDMSMCKGITEFGSKNNDGATLKTFQGCVSLVSIILPPNLAIIPDNSGNGLFTDCSNLATVTFSGTGNATYDSDGNLTSGLVIGKMAFDGLTGLTTVTLSSNLAVIDEGAFNKCTGLTTLTMNGHAVYDDKCNVVNPVVINKQAFFQNTSLVNLTLSDNLTYIGVEAFDQTSSLQVVHIPASVQTIGYKAFNECPALTTVYFDDTTCPDCDKVETLPSMTIASYAFMNAQHIADVYIENRTPISCTNKAFAFDITFGQSNPTNPMARLHYPKGQEAHYTNLDHLLTDAIARDPGKFQGWLMDHFGYAQIPPSMNGWHEFVTSAPATKDPDDPTPTDGVILCTFSDVNLAHLVPPGIKAFIVNGINPTSDGNSYELSLEPIRVIPAKTGVILYGEPNAIASDGTPYLSLTPVKFAVGEGQPLRRDYWTDLTEGQEHLKNYLLPTSDDDGNAIEIGPTDKEGKKVIWRNFAMNRYSATKTLSEDYPMEDVANDFIGFFRCLKEFSIDPGHAYLHLSAVNDSEKGLVEEFTQATGGEIIVNMYSNYQTEYKLDSTTGETYNGYDKGFWHNAVWANPKPNWGNRAAAFGNSTNLPHFVYRGELDEEADGVVTLTIPADNNQEGDIYTLQGVKVNNPAKGVYIRNGKKVIIK